MPTLHTKKAYLLNQATYTHTHTHTHTHPFNGPFSKTTRVSWYQKGKTNLDFTEATDSEWQWHQLGNMHVCNSLQTDNHASTPPLVFYRPDPLPAAQPTASKQPTDLFLNVYLIPHFMHFPSTYINFPTVDQCLIHSRSSCHKLRLTLTAFRSIGSLMTS